MTITLCPWSDFIFKDMQVLKNDLGIFHGCFCLFLFFPWNSLQNPYLFFECLKNINSN